MDSELAEFRGLLAEPLHGALNARRGSGRHDRPSPVAARHRRRPGDAVPAELLDRLVHAHDAGRDRRSRRRCRR